MAFTVNIDASGAINMLNTQAAELPAVIDNLGRDMAALVQEKTVNETINALPGTMPIAPAGSRQVVGVQTGMLKRSLTGLLERIETGVYKLSANQTIAPYAVQVARKVYERHGLDFLHVTVHFYGAKMVKGVVRELDRFFKLTGGGRRYRYQNPFR